MELLKQTNPNFPQEVRRYGCRFMLLLAIPQLYAKKPLTHGQIMVIFRVGKADPTVIGENCRTGKNEHLLMQNAFALLGMPTFRARQIGRMKGDNPVYWNAKVPFQYMAGHWVTCGPDGHWTLFDHEGFELYDSWDRLEAVGIVGLEDYYEIRKRVVDKRLLYRVWENPAVGG
jgi:hypothetical protein